MPPPRHWSWDYYESTYPVNPKVAKCLACGHQYSNGSVARMTKHLRDCKLFEPHQREEINQKIASDPKVKKSSFAPYFRDEDSAFPNDDEDFRKTLGDIVRASISSVVPLDSSVDSISASIPPPHSSSLQNVNKLLAKVWEFNYLLLLNWFRGHSKY